MALSGIQNRRPNGLEGTKSLEGTFTFALIWPINPHHVSRQKWKHNLQPVPG